MTTADDVINQATKDIGYVEQGGSDGKSGNITKYGAWYGLQGSPYCAMGLSYWFFNAGMPLPASSSKGFAYTPSGAAWFQQNNAWTQTPKRGYVVFFKFPGSSRIDHVGLVTAVNPDGSIQTIEANTSSGNTGSQSNGGGVYRRTRKASIAGYGIPNYSKDNSVPVYPAAHAALEFMAYDTGVTGGVRVASGDVNGDGKEELVTVPGPGYPAHVKVFDPANPGTPLASFYAFPTDVTCGFFVSCEDVDNDGVVEIVVTPDHGGGPHVRIFKFADVKTP